MFDVKISGSHTAGVESCVYEYRWSGNTVEDDSKMNSAPLSWCMLGNLFHLLQILHSISTSDAGFL